MSSCTCAKIFGKRRHMASLMAFSLDGFSNVSRGTPLSIVRYNTCITPLLGSVLRHDLERRTISAFDYLEMTADGIDRPGFRDRSRSCFWGTLATHPAKRRH